MESRSWRVPYWTEVEGLETTGLRSRYPSAVWQTWAAVLLSFGVIGFIAYWTVTLNLPVPGALLFTFIWVLVIIVAAVGVLVWVQVKTGGTMRGKFGGGTMTVSQDGISLESKFGSTTQMNWNKVNEFVELKDRYIFRMSPKIGFAVAKKSFRPRTEADAFATAVAGYFADRRPESPPEIASVDLADPIISITFVPTMDDIMTAANRRLPNYNKWFNIVSVLIIAPLLCSSIVVFLMPHRHHTNPLTGLISGFIVSALIFSPYIRRALRGESLIPKLTDTPQMRAIALPPHTVGLTSSGMFKSVGDAHSPCIPWANIVSVVANDQQILFANANNIPLAFVPVGAFRDSDEHGYFLAVANAFVNAAKTGVEPVLPERPVSWPPAPNVPLT